MSDVLDLDQVRAAYISDHPMEYRTLKLYGREWAVRMDPNVVILMEFAGSGGIDAQVDFIMGYIRSDQREDFRIALRADEYLNEEMLERLINWFTQQSTGRPSEPSSASEPSSSPSGENSTDTSLAAEEQDSTPSD